MTSQTPNPDPGPGPNLYPPDRKPTLPSFDTRLACVPERLVYDFTTRTGHLYMLQGDCCDMQGAVALFQAIDPRVVRVVTASGDALDTCYETQRGGWVAKGPPHDG
jgi:hypothetical protein